MTAITGTDMTKRDERRAMSVASGAHAVHDGYTDLIYVMLPVSAIAWPVCPAASRCCCSRSWSEA